MFDSNTLLSLFSKGGIMQIFIVLSSIIAVAIIFERYFVYLKVNKDLRVFSTQIKKYLTENKIDEASEFLSKNSSYFTPVIVAGLNSASHGREVVSESMEAEGKKIIFDLEKGLSTLATISGVAPLLGFLGTVTGMISAFMKIQSLDGVVNPSDLAGGIWEALITTATGLAVGIIALTFYNYFLSRVKKITIEMESLANFVLNKISEMEIK